MFTAFNLCALLRIGEITKTSSPIKHFLLYGNVSMSFDEQYNNFSKIKIPQFKHAKSTNASLRLYQNKTNSHVCPFLSLLSYLKGRKHISHLLPCSHKWMFQPALNIILHNNFC